MTTVELVAEFTARLIPIGEAPARIGYSALYGRRLILAKGMEDKDYFYITGRIFVDKDFLSTLANFGD